MHPIETATRVAHEGFNLDRMHLVIAGRGVVTVCKFSNLLTHTSSQEPLFLLWVITGIIMGYHGISSLGNSIGNTPVNPELLLLTRNRKEE